MRFCKPTYNYVFLLPVQLSSECLDVIFKITFGAATTTGDVSGQDKICTCTKKYYWCKTNCVCNIVTGRLPKVSIEVADVNNYKGSLLLVDAVL